MTGDTASFPPRALLFYLKAELPFMTFIYLFILSFTHTFNEYCILLPSAPNHWTQRVKDRLRGLVLRKL